MNKKLKLSFDFTERGAAIFKDIFKKSGLKNWSTMFHVMLRIYDTYLEKKEQGYKLAFVKGEDVKIINDNFGDC